MRFRYIAAAFGMAVVFSSFESVLAQDRPEDYRIALKADCAKELKGMCKGVEDGSGRLLACLYSREDKLSQRCDLTLAGSIERLGEALGALANVRRACQRDALRLCNGIVPGDGNLINCLTIGRSSVSSECNATLDAAFLPP